MEAVGAKIEVKGGPEVILVAGALPNCRSNQRPRPPLKSINLGATTASRFKIAFSRGQQISVKRQWRRTKADFSTPVKRIASLGRKAANGNTYIARLWHFQRDL